jgi:hypothetical protein
MELRQAPRRGRAEGHRLRERQPPALSDFIFPYVLAAVAALKQLNSPVLMRVKQFKNALI